MAISTTIEMLAPDCDLDDVCRLRFFVRVLNKLNIPAVNTETKIFTEVIIGKRCAVYIHTNFKNLWV